MNGMPSSPLAAPKTAHEAVVRAAARCSCHWTTNHTRSGEARTSKEPQPDLRPNTCNGFNAEVGEGTPR
jgi:hypothetical protein